MKYKRIVVTMLVIFPLLVGLACNLSLPKFLSPKSDSDTIEDLITDIIPEPEVEIPTEAVAEPVPSDFQELAKLENTYWSQQENEVLVTFFLQNLNSDVVFEDVDYTIYLLDASGAEINNSPGYISMVYPNQTVGIAYTFYLSEEDAPVDDINIVWEYSNTSPANGRTNPFTVDKITFWENGDYPLVTGLINNLGNATITDIRANMICFDAAGQIVGGAYDYIEFVPATDYIGFANSVDISGEVASVEVYPVQGYSTTVLEDESSWSDISVKQDYFYEDQYGTIYGGLVIQNNSSAPLKSSIAYVTFYDAQGNVTTTAVYGIDTLLPNDTLGVIPYVFSPPEGAVTAEYDVLVLPGTPEDGYELTQNPFVVNEAIITGDYDHNVKVNFTNTHSNTVSEVDVTVAVFDASGAIIGGGTDWWTEPTAPGGSAEVEVYVFYGSDRVIDRVEAWVTPNYFTDFE